MSFANHNILDIALSIIPPTVVQIRKNLGTKVNKYGQSESSYSEWIEVYGIVQPGSEQNEHTERVDFSKKHVSIWLRGVALDGTHIQSAPDQIRYLGRIFNVTNVDDWFAYDNYRKCDCVEALNIGETQRSGLQGSNQNMSKRGLASWRKVVPKNPNGESVDNLNPPIDIQRENEDHQAREDEKMEEPREESIKQKDTSLVGKARIRF